MAVTCSYKSGLEAYNHSGSFQVRKPLPLPRMQHPSVGL